jgi:uncharacterized protein
MDNVSLELNERMKGAFVIKDGDKQLGEMVVSIMDNNLTVYHTEVAPEAEGKGLAKKMLQAMVDYSRGNNLHVIPLCPYVHAQFSRHPQQYADLWQAGGEKK